MAKAAALFSIAFLGLLILVNAWAAPPLCQDVLVLVDSSTGFLGEFTHRVQPYLDWFGVPYVVFDLASGKLPDPANHSLLVFGHRGIKVGDDQVASILSARDSGVGIVAFDGHPSLPSNVLEKVFGVAPKGRYSTMDRIGIEDVGHPVTALQNAGSEFLLANSIEGARVKPLGADVLAKAGEFALLLARRQTNGKSLYWSSTDWIKCECLGPLAGMDDLVWRGLAWAARKPFVMEGMPPFLTLRVDDCYGGDAGSEREMENFSWVIPATQAGFTPWLGLMLDEINEVEASALKGLYSSGLATIAVHAKSQCNSFYFDHECHYGEEAASLPDSTVQEYFDSALSTLESWGIEPSTYLVPHWHELGLNTFQGLASMGVKIIGAVLPVGTSTSQNKPLFGAPYRVTDAPASDFDWSPRFFADWVKVPGHPELDGQFFNVITEIRDADCTGDREWKPTAKDPEGSIERGVEYLRRSLDGMILATLYCHEYAVDNLSIAQWGHILNEVVGRLSTRQLEFVDLDSAVMYVMSKQTAKLSSVAFLPETKELLVSWSGRASTPLRYMAFTEEDGCLEHTWLNATCFDGVVSLRASLDNQEWFETEPIKGAVHRRGLWHKIPHPPSALMLMAAVSTAVVALNITLASLGEGQERRSD